MFNSLPLHGLPGLHGIARRWHRWTTLRSDLYELDPAGRQQMELLAQDLALPAGDLDLLLSRDGDPSLLLRRMAALRLDPDDIGRSEPAMFRDLQRVCVMCESRGECIRDLAAEETEPGSPNWRDYCPNVATLNMLAALESYSYALADDAVTEEGQDVRKS